MLQLDVIGCNSCTLTKDVTEQRAADHLQRSFFAAQEDKSRFSMPRLPGHWNRLDRNGQNEWKRTLESALIDSS